VTVPYDHQRDITRAIELLQEWVKHGPAEATQALHRTRAAQDFDTDNMVLATVRVAATLADIYAEEHQVDAEGAVELAALELDVV
jgi:hypothetical protein